VFNYGELDLSKMELDNDEYEIMVVKAAIGTTFTFAHKNVSSNPL